MKLSETLKPIGHGHAGPPALFVEMLVKWGRDEDDSVFAPNKRDDIYGYMKPVLAPLGWLSLNHRRAAMLEALRVIAGDESDWNWKEGRDVTAGHQTPEEMEAGAFQVSYDSANLGEDLKPFLETRGIRNADQFQRRIKSDPLLDMAYTARVLRDSTKWEGPLNRGWIREQVSPKAVEEFMALLEAPAIR